MTTTIDTSTSNRADMRRELRERRRAIPAPERIAAAERLASHLFALPFLPATGDVAGYWAMDGEIALHVFQLHLPPGLRYCLPVLSGESLRFAAWRPGQALASNRYGIPEPDVAEDALLQPQAMALVVCPLVGFDGNGKRLGMGGGWYDRSFAYRNNATREAGRRPPWLVGAAFATQQVSDLATGPWDVALDAVCTERDTVIAQQ
ncbi:MAG: 5-formyltetrahydrofolate cyclo-ligase [Luteimonas sp.]